MRRRIAIIVVVAFAVWVAAAAIAEGTACREGTVHRFTLLRGVTHWGFTVRVPASGSLGVELRFSRIFNRHAHFQVTIRRRSWSSRVLMIDTAHARQCSGHRAWRTCRASRPQTHAGTYSSPHGSSRPRARACVSSRAGRVHALVHPLMSLSSRESDQHAVWSSSS
jgi:hypothetical protein